MKKVALVSFVAAAALAVSAQETFRAGEGVANGVGSNVTWAPRGAGNDYGYGGGTQYHTPLGLTLLAWDIPNSMSVVCGLRANLGCGRFERTYGIDLGAFSKSGETVGVAGNIVGNFCERDADGLLVGVVNMVDGDMNGVQIGLVNKASRLRGVQIGLINFNPSGISFPILNCGF